ncbi:hypothetical protein GCM10012286_27380 [Streptomyces lasiicapitis]|uniref:Uncharacterized protein n=1 Tax=Streptomyces lasiicapitis TaxID=1923961 RepID=A0ABQ2LV96_9ACTN|nr:hypothetical protein GCM10012286_27380 [Streptomyces lasiicapitis]
MTVWLPSLVTVPETVTVSPSRGAAGVSEFRETFTVREPVAAAFGRVAAVWALVTPLLVPALVALDVFAVTSEDAAYADGLAGT